LFESRVEDQRLQALSVRLENGPERERDACAARLRLGVDRLRRFASSAENPPTETFIVITRW
jgi:hypothetical protein